MNNARVGTVKALYIKKNMVDGAKNIDDIDGYEERNILIKNSQIERVKKLQLLTENEVKILCHRARDLFMEEGNVLMLSAPITVFTKIYCIMIL